MRPPGCRWTYRRRAIPWCWKSWAICTCCPSKGDGRGPSPGAWATTLSRASRRTGGASPSSPTGMDPTRCGRWTGTAATRRRSAAAATAPTTPRRAGRRTASTWWSRRHPGACAPSNSGPTTSMAGRGCESRRRRQAARPRPTNSATTPSARCTRPMGATCISPASSGASATT